MKKRINKISFILILIMLAVSNISCSTVRTVLGVMTLGTSELIIGTTEAVVDIANMFNKIARDGNVASFDEIDTFSGELKP